MNGRKGRTHMYVGFNKKYKNDRFERSILRDAMGICLIAIGSAIFLVLMLGCSVKSIDTTKETVSATSVDMQFALTKARMLANGRRVIWTDIQKERTLYKAVLTLDDRPD
tara:strand:+ start:1868 stop:2197 length:330 start_codon:yes stop_codon:yes gene_type:complete